MSKGDDSEWAIRDLLGSNPDVVAGLLRGAGVDVPEYATASVEPVDWEEIIPKECLADGVLYFHEDTELKIAIAVDVQLTTGDPDARLEWPTHLTWLYAEYARPTGLVVLAPDPEVAQWSAEPIDSGSLHLTPLVFGPEHLHLLPDGARRALDRLIACGAKPREFPPDVLAELFRHVIDDDNARGFREYLRGVGYVLPDRVRASFTVKGRGPLRSWRLR